MAGECDSARAAAVRLSSGNAGCSALTRRCAVPLHRIVNCAPAKGCVWPVIAPAQAFVRAGAVLRGAAALLRRSGVDALSEALSGTPGQSSPMGKLSPAGILLSVRVCTGDWAASRVPIGMSRVHLKPVARSYCGVLRSITPAVCRLAPNRTACGILRSCSAGSRSPIVRTRDVGAVICLCGFTSGLAVSLWRSRRVTGGRGGRRTELAARPLCLFAWSYWS